jgi:hypothetical protein
MSPKFSIVSVLVSVLAFALMTSATERRDPNVTTSSSLAPKATEHGTPQTEPNQARGVVLPDKDPTVDLSRTPFPLTFGTITVGAFHVFPARESGPHIGPPARIWGLGFATSLWRDPVTGWPEP